MPSPVENAEKDKVRQDVVPSPKELAAWLRLVLKAVVMLIANTAHQLCASPQAECFKYITSFKLCNKSVRGWYYLHFTD